MKCLCVITIVRRYNGIKLGVSSLDHFIIGQEQGNKTLSWNIILQFYFKISVSRIYISIINVLVGTTSIWTSVCPCVCPKNCAFLHPPSAFLRPPPLVFLRPPIDKDTGALGHCNTWAMGHQDTGTPGQWDNVCAFRSSHYINRIVIILSCTLHLR